MRVLIVTALWVRDTYTFEHLDRFFFGLFTLESLVKLDAFLNLFADFLQRVQGGHRVLHDHRDFFTANGHPFIFCFVFGNIYAIVCDTASGNGTVGIQHTDKGLCKYRLTGTGLAYDRKSLSLIQVKGALSDCHQLTATHTELDFHIFSR